MILNSEVNNSPSVLCCSVVASSVFLAHYPTSPFFNCSRQFYTLGWVTGTGGGITIKQGWVTVRMMMS